MKSLMNYAVAFFIVSILVGVGWWMDFGWVAGVTVGGTVAAATLGVIVWSILKARHRRS